MWERSACHSILALIFGEGFNYATRNMRKAKRDAILAGMLVWVGIWVLCFAGETLIPPLRALEQCFDELTWIRAKVVVWLLALPVGFPAGSVLAYRYLKRKAERMEREGLDPETGLPACGSADPVKARAERIRHGYEVGVAVLLWVWFWFFTPAQMWIEERGEGMFTRSMGLLAVWLLLAALLGTGGGKLVYRAAERRLRGLN